MGSIVVEHGIRWVGSSQMWHNVRETSGEPPLWGSSSWSYQSPLLPSAGACNSIGRYTFLHYCIRTLPLSLASITRHGMRIERWDRFSIILAKLFIICNLFKELLHLFLWIFSSGLSEDSITLFWERSPVTSEESCSEISVETCVF